MGTGSSQPRTVAFENKQPIQLTEAALRKITQQQQESENNSNENAPPPARDYPQYPQIPPSFYKPQYDYAAEEEYWTKRIDALKRTHGALNKKMEQEYDKAVAETAQMFKRAQSSHVNGRLPPCQDAKNSVLKCYNENATQPLLCAGLVNEFNNCVNSKRLETAPTGA